MRDLDAGDRPREKLEASGAATLGDNELVALLIGHGRAGENALDLANALLEMVSTVQGLTRVDRRELLRVPGVGPVVAARILAGVEVGRRTLVREAPMREQFLHAAQVAGYLLPRYGAHPQERFGVMTLDARHRLLRVTTISVGALNVTAAHPRAVFREAALVNAAAVVVFHNHPSGDPHPSAADVDITQRLVDAGHLLDIPVIDHLILADNRYCSLRTWKDIRWDG